MKKVIAIIVALLLLALPYFLPIPIMTSGFVAQYELGRTLEFDVAAWNIAPLPREIKGGNPTDIVLVVDGKPVATTPTQVSPRMSQFSRVEQTVSYTLSKEPSDTPRFDTATGQVQLPPGKHKVSVQWLGSSSLGSSVRIIEL